MTEDRGDNAAEESFFTLKHGQSALVAEISEHWQECLGDAMHPRGGVIYPRANTAFGANYYSDDLCPYYYAPL